MLASAVLSCEKKDPTQPDGSQQPEIPNVDYVGELKLDMSTTSLKQKVTVKSYIDGDTTHFDLTSPINGKNVLKARYLAVNTPESTGKIEVWGKKASNFTKEKLKNAVSIIVESDNEQWNLDSTGDRTLVWVWYQPSEGADYRNLNLELLQNGLAIASNSAQNRYGSTCMKAITQAKLQQLHVYSKEKDPDFPYGEATEITLKELRINLETYNGAKVAFEGVITRDYGNTVYVEMENPDPETGLIYGISVYYGFNMNGFGMDILQVGNKVRIVGSVQYYETGGTYQISGLEYRAMKPEDPNNIQKLGEGYEPSYVLTDAQTFLSTGYEIALEDEVKSFAYAELVMNTTIRMENLMVVDVYTTDNEDSSSNGAMTLTCKTADGLTVSVRTVVLYDADGKLVTAEAYEGKTIDVRGLVDFYNGTYQIKVISVNDIIIK
jgi:endonuclease YncB( thermonuclease family)